MAEQSPSQDPLLFEIEGYVKDPENCESNLFTVSNAQTGQIYHAIDVSTESLRKLCDLIQDFIECQESTTVTYYKSIVIEFPVE